MARIFHAYDKINQNTLSLRFLPETKQHMSEILGGDKPIYEDNHIIVYKIPKSNSLEPFLLLGSGWHTYVECEPDDERKNCFARVTMKNSEILIINPTESTINITLEIVLKSILDEKTLTIYFNNEKLERGSDYQIDYFSGIIVLNTNIDPNGNIEIVYDKHDLVTFDRKIMVGSRAQVDFDENSFLGMTALYYNQDIVNKKVEVGYEPIQNFIWDINGRYERDLENLSASLNKLNMFDAEKLSRFQLEGEIAQVLPNPNSISNSSTGDGDGVAYIDDFEGSKRITNPSILRNLVNFCASNPPFDGSYSLILFSG